MLHHHTDQPVENRRKLIFILSRHRRAEHFHGDVSGTVLFTSSCAILPSSKNRPIDDFFCAINHIDKKCRIRPAALLR